MRMLFPTALAASASLAIAGCGSNDSADTDQTQASSPQTASSTDAANPFADAEKKMSNDMMAAIGTDAGDSWVRKMIVHHQGAIDMSNIVLQQNPSPDVRKMAQDTIDKQKAEIADLEKLRKDGPPNQQSADVYRQSMMDMQQKMMAATGGDMNETFMRKMLAHHEGGVAMSEVALNNGVSGAVRSQARKTREGQQKEAEMTRAMLNGQPMRSEPKAPAASQPAAMQPTSSRSGSPSPAPATSPSHDMSNMSNMSGNGQ